MTDTTMMYDRLLVYLGDFAEDTSLTRRVLRSAVDEAAERAEDDGEDLTVDGVRAVLHELITNDYPADDLIWSADAVKLFEEYRAEVISLLLYGGHFDSRNGVEDLAAYAARVPYVADGAAERMIKIAWLARAGQIIDDIYTAE